jgi:multiple sugar transport system ATP-binding protein
MVRNPALFLMDEPLSNLDVQLRVKARSQISQLHRGLGSTFIYVTHDQTEAMTMSNKIAVMFNGELVQVGSPSEVYRDPADIRIARFISNPTLNTFPVTYDPAGELKRVLDSAGGCTQIMAFRSEDCFISPDDEGSSLVGHIVHIENTGSDAYANVEVVPGNDPIVVRVDPRRHGGAIGDRVGIVVDDTRILLFDSHGHRVRGPLRTGSFA